MNAIQLILAVALPEQQPTIFQERDDLPSNLFVPGDLLPVDAEAEATYARWPVRHNHPSHAGVKSRKGTPQIGDHNPSAYRQELVEAGLAGSLSNLALRLSESGRSAEALPYADTAVALFRQLAETNPDRYHPELARSLYNLAAILSTLGQHSKAEQLRSEAETLRINR